MKNSEILNANAIEMAKNHALEGWETHVAVRNDLSRSESCLFCPKCNEFIDEDVSLLGNGSWCGSYRETYWTFFLVVDFK